MKHRIRGGAAIVVGLVLLAPAAMVFVSRVFSDAIGLGPTWLNQVIAVMAVCGVGVLLAGLAFLGRR